jgi:YbgC/YbaW family acyl-CoA thioester hydrolase
MDNVTPAPPPLSVPLGRTKFETEMAVRPDDLDLFQHVHASRYIDYVFAARYDQMARCYGMAWEEFTKLGFAWVMRTAFLDYKRPLRMGDRFVVRTWVEAAFKDGVQVNFEIVKSVNRKLCCDGHIHYTMVRLDTGRAEKIPDWIIAKYAV